MPTLTLGISPCPNDVFVFSGLLLNKIDTHGLDFEVAFQDVENLNQRAQSGDLDVVKISYANYLHCKQEYDLLSRGGALGRGVGPMLLTNAKETREEGKETASAFDSTREVLVPGAYTTANFLLDFFADQDGNASLRKRFLPFDALYEELCRTPGAQGVVIHEKRFTFANDGLTLVQDLGEYWEQQTGYAIPLGAICVRRSLGLAAPLDDLIRRSLAWAYVHYADAFALCQQYAQDLSEGVIEAHIKLYVNQFTEALGPEGEAAVNFFLNKQKTILQFPGGS
jgi:1,4-dihydroxy-6-naphthoate synthase